MIEWIRKWWRHRRFMSFCVGTGDPKADKRITSKLLAHMNSDSKFVVGTLPVDTPDRNGNVYPREVLEAAVKGFQRQIMEGNALVVLKDNSGRNWTDYRKVVGVITRMDGPDYEIELLGTPPGKLIQESMAAGVDLSIDVEGSGEVKDGVVQPGHHMFGISIGLKED